MDKYKDLRNKTIFDFCDDKEILEDITAFYNKAEYLEYINDYSGEKSMLRILAEDFLQLAFEIDDKMLEKEVRRQFPKEIKEYEAMFYE